MNVIKQFFVAFSGASPDSKVCCDDGTVIMEVKCPYSARNMTVTEACALKNFCLHLVNGKPTIRPSNEYYAQVQGQLLISGAPYCIFVVYTKHPSECLFWEKIYPDKDFMANLLKKLKDLYDSHIKPAIEKGTNVPSPGDSITEDA